VVYCLRNTTAGNWKVRRLQAFIKDYLALKYQIMMTNLSKSFSFQKNEKNYSVDYIFKNEIDGGGLSLTMDVSVNDGAKTTHIINRPTATLYQSNELIEKMITEEIMSFTN
jgi:hypothetical protein